MTTGQVLVGVGFIMAAAGTLFLSIDVFGFEKSVTRTLQYIVHAVWLDQQSRDTRNTAPSGPEATKKINEISLGEIYQIMEEAEVKAKTQTIASSGEEAQDIAKTFRKHYYWIILSMILVLAGGAIGLIGTLVFHP